MAESTFISRHPGCWGHSWLPRKQSKNYWVNDVVFALIFIYSTALVNCTQIVVKTKWPEFLNGVNLLQSIPEQTPFGSLLQNHTSSCQAKVIHYSRTNPCSGAKAVHGMTTSLPLCYSFCCTLLSSFHLSFQAKWSEQLCLLQGRGLLLHLIFLCIY